MSIPGVSATASASPPHVTTPRSRGWIAGVFYVLLAASAITLAGTLLATAILLAVLVVVRPPLRYDAAAARTFVLPFLLLLAVILASAVVNPDWRTNLREGLDYRLVLLPLMMLFVLPNVDTRRMLQVLCVVASLMALYGAYQVATGEDPLYWYRTGTTRARGGFTHALTYAGYMLPLSLLFSALAVAERARWRWGWGIGAVCAVAAIILSQSRSGAVGLVVGGCVLLYRWKRGVTLGVLIGATVLGVLLVGFSGRIGDRLPDAKAFPGASLLSRFLVIEPLRDQSIRDRLYLWEAGLRGWMERPLLGFGSGMHGRHLEPYQRAVAAAHGDSDYVYSTGYNTSLHNVLVRMLFNLGVIGLGSYLWMWARVFITIHGGLRDAARDDPWRTDVLWGLAAGFIGLNVAGFFEDNFFDAEVQILTLILMMLAFHESQRPVRSESGAPA